MASTAACKAKAHAGGGRLELRLYIAQRLSALILAPLVLVHLAGIVYATRGGLSAAEILARTEGSPLFAAFYGLFVLAAAVHAPIGLRTIAREMTPWHGRSLDAAACLVALLVLALGLRAVAAIT
jgi:fumarate reductase subunit C